MDSRSEEDDEKEAFVRDQKTLVKDPRVLSLQFGDVRIGYVLRLPPGSTREPRVHHPHTT